MPENKQYGEKVDTIRTWEKQEKNNIQLDGMRPWEKTLAIIKRHWIVLVQVCLYFLFGVLMTIVVYIFVQSIWVHLGMLIFWMIYSIFLYIQWIDHELDMYFITNNRIIWVEQIGFLNRRVSECNLWQVQEVGSHTKWLLANLFNYGTVKIQTAWNATNFHMTYAPLPLINSRKILNIVDDYRDKQADHSDL